MLAEEIVRFNKITCFTSLLSLVLFGEETDFQVNLAGSQENVVSDSDMV